MYLLLERMHRILNFSCIEISNIIFSLWILIAIFDGIFEAIFIYCTYLYYTCYDSPNILKSSSILHKLQNFFCDKDICENWEKIWNFYPQRKKSIEYNNSKNMNQSIIELSKSEVRYQCILRVES
jgi:hypothetical protein